MSALAANRPWPVYAVPVAIMLAAIGMLFAAIEHAQIGKSALLDTVIGASFIVALVAAIGALLLATARRNVMWILGVALACTELLALLAMVLSEMAVG